MVLLIFTAIIEALFLETLFLAFLFFFIFEGTLTP